MRKMSHSASVRKRRRSGQRQKNNGRLKRPKQCATKKLRSSLQPQIKLKVAKKMSMATLGAPQREEDYHQSRRFQEKSFPQSGSYGFLRQSGDHAGMWTISRSSIILRKDPMDGYHERKKRLLGRLWL